MKKLGKWFAALLLVVCATACNDPYEGDTFSVYDTQPAATYLSSRSDEFSEWISIMKYADLYNAVNQATQYFTLFVPTNNAVKEFLQKKGASSIEELGVEYARNLVKFHIVQDTISQEQFVEQEGALAKKSVSDDYLSVSFRTGEGEGGGMQSVYLNKEARVVEFANPVSNGFVYVLGSVLNPLTESAYARLTEQGRPFTILKAALDATTWKDSIDIIYNEVKDNAGNVINKIKRNYTVLAVSDEVFRNNGINDLASLAQKLGAGSNYTDKSNALFQYVAYHILPDSYDLKKLKTFDAVADISKIYDTCSTGNVISITQPSEENTFYLNYKDEDNRTTFLEDDCDLAAKNGYIHQLAGYLPIAEAEPEKVLFDVCNFTIIKEWIEAGNGETGIKYQTAHESNEYKCDIAGLNCYMHKLVNPSGTFNSYYNITYFTVKTKSSLWATANNNDMLMLNLGNTGWISMQTPAIVKGKYKVTLQFGFATSMDFIRTSSSGSNGGQLLFTIDGTDLSDRNPYRPIAETVPKKELNLHQNVMNPEFEFTETATHTLKIQFLDPAASSNSSYRIYIDYILFEPITE